MGLFSHETLIKGRHTEQGLGSLKINEIFTNFAGFGYKQFWKYGKL